MLMSRVFVQVDGGTYFCRASNDVGTSDELAITFTVRYEPRNIRCAGQIRLNY